MNARSLERLALETALHRAPPRDELQLYFQPVMKAEGGELVAVEALLRWRHPDLGLVSPADFIPPAEDTGLIVPIGEWVLRSACEHHRRWCEAGGAPLHMMVNISARQFREEGFAAMVGSVLAETSMTPGDLTLELTESMLMDDTDRALAPLDHLRALGVCLFWRSTISARGIRRSPISKRFPIDELKIDRLFVRGIDRNTRDAALVSAIVSLGHSLGLRVVAGASDRRPPRRAAPPGAATWRNPRLPLQPAPGAVARGAGKTPVVKAYPPAGWAPRSSPAQIATCVAPYRAAPGRSSRSAALRFS